MKSWQRERRHRPETLAALLLSLSVAFAARAEPCKAMEVTHERSERTAAGVTRSERWTDRVLRCGDEAYVERLFATPMENTPRERREPDLERAAWHLHRLPDGKAQVQLVFRELRMVVDLKPVPDFEVVGFDGRFDSVADPRPTHVGKGVQSYDIQVRPLPVPKGALPWTTLSGFEHKTLDELGD